MRHIPIRLKLILSFSLVAALVLIILVIRSIYDQKQNQTQLFANLLEQYKTLILQDAKAQQDFLTADLNSEQFYLSQASQNYDDHRKWQQRMHEVVEKMRQLSLVENYSFEDDIIDMKNHQARYEKAFEKLAESSIALGFKDYGIIGDMRRYAHALEDSFQDVLPLEMLLMLRRHEKDFIIRKEEAYAKKFITLTYKINQHIDAHTETERVRRARTQLQSYTHAFQSLYVHSTRNGLTSENGLRADLKRNENELVYQVNELITRNEQFAQAARFELRLYFWISIAAFTIVMIWLVNYLAQLLSRPILTLADRLETFVKEDFETEFKLNRFENRGDELGHLYRHFRKLGEEITVHFKNYRAEAEKRHHVILEKSMQIETQHKELQMQKTLLDDRNKSVMDSISYAQRLQLAIFPSAEKIQRILGDYLLTFSPKDIVSGDFYWIEETPDSIFIAVADCTGHGVPGAFMSLLGNNYLNQAIDEMALRETNEILDYLNTSISELLNHNYEAGEIKDGMDIALCRWIKAEGILQFSGANRPLTVVRNAEVLHYKSDRFPIGWMLDYQRKPFTSTRITIEENDLLFLYSDGYCDQFGGNDDKKFKSHRFAQILSEMRVDQFNANQHLLYQAFEKWKGHREQVDDVCVLGFGANELLSYNKQHHLSQATPAKTKSINKELNKFKVVG